MEFFEETNQTYVDVPELQKLLAINNLPKLCESITNVIFDNKVNGSIYCLWGEFEINREELKDGIRFSMPKCPNALAWTITTNRNGTLTIHCTINKKEHDQDFIDSIEEFVSDWKIGLNGVIGRST